MKIGVVIFADTFWGGAYQYTFSLVKSLSQLNTDDEFIAFGREGNPLLSDSFLSPAWKKAVIEPDILTRNSDFRSYLCGDGLDLSRSGINERARDFFLKHQIDILIYPTPEILSFECGIPYIMAIHDLQHRLQAEFPEVSAMGQWNGREYLFRNGIRYANAILADSEVGKEDVLNFYGEHISEDRVYPLPFLPAYKPNRVTEEQKINLVRKYSLPFKYLFYPSQFWFHKNHSRLVHAIHLLRVIHKTDVPLILVGSNSGSPSDARGFVFDNVIFIAEQLGVKDLVRYMGYVPDEDMPALYAMALALVMPTFFGPTNIPVYDAWIAGCPVISSDIRGVREQVGNAGIVVDQKNPSAIADAIFQIWNDEYFRQELIRKGYEQVAMNTPEIFRNKLYTIINDVKKSLLDSKSEKLSLAKDMRKQFAVHWLNLSGDQLEKAYIGDMGNQHRRIMESNIRNEPLTQEENIFLQHLIAELTKRSATDPVSAMNYLLAIMLYLPSGRLKIENARASLPGWLIGDYEGFFGF